VLQILFQCCAWTLLQLKSLKLWSPRICHLQILTDIAVASNSVLVVLVVNNNSLSLAPCWSLFTSYGENLKIKRAANDCTSDHDHYQPQTYVV
jgi:hypothetical protein